jgi:hypothetical protein
MPVTLKAGFPGTNLVGVSLRPSVGLPGLPFGKGRHRHRDRTSAWALRPSEHGAKDQPWQDRGIVEKRENLMSKDCLAHRIGGYIAVRDGKARAYRKGEIGNCPSHRIHQGLAVAGPNPS